MDQFYLDLLVTEELYLIRFKTKALRGPAPGLGDSSTLSDWNDAARYVMGGIRLNFTSTKFDKFESKIKMNQSKYWQRKSSPPERNFL